MSHLSTLPLDMGTTLAQTLWLILTLLMKKFGVPLENHSKHSKGLLDLVFQELKWR